MQDFPPWQQGFRTDHPALRGAKQADVVIVGGGLTGACCAVMLSGHGLRVILLESNVLGCGASWACTGKLTAFTPGIYRTCAETVSMEAASAFARLAQEAVAGVSDLIRRYGFGCGRAAQSAAVYAEHPSDMPSLEDDVRLGQRLGLNVSLSQDVGDCPMPVKAGAFLRDQATLLPMPYLLGMADAAERSGCVIYEHSPVHDIKGTTVFTPEGHVKAGTVLLCTGSPIGCRSLTTLALMEQRICVNSYLRGGAPFHDSYLSVCSDGLNLRPLKDGMLASQALTPVGGKAEERRLQRFTQLIAERLGDWREADRCIRQDVWSTDGLPLIGALHPRDGRVLCATGFSGWGLTGSYLAARLLTGQLLGQPLAEASLFFPFRTYAGRTSAILRGSKLPVKAYINGWGHPFAPRCPHLGCRLRFDPETRHWVCPCHGSTFNLLGEALTGPTIKDVAISRRQQP